jgi:hypothetical protein
MCQVPQVYFDTCQKLIVAIGNSPLMLACHHRYTYDLVSVLLGRGADVNAKNRYGDTCLLNVFPFFFLRVFNFSGMCIGACRIGYSIIRTKC